MAQQGKQAEDECSRYERHGDRNRESSRRWYARHREQALARNAEWKRNHRHWLAQYSANIRRRTKERIGDSQKPIREWRKAHGMKQYEFAAMLGVSQSTLCKWEIGELSCQKHIDQLRALGINI